METQIQKNKQNNQLTIDSREVAKMLEVEHWQVLRKLEGTKDGKSKGILTILNDNKIVVVKYFIKSEYKDDKGETRPCYLFTKMGCEFIANKFTGEKGILFTAKYVDKFNEMEKYIEQDSQPKLPKTYKEALVQLLEQVEENERLSEKNKGLSLENGALVSDILKWADTNIINAIVRKYAKSVQGDFAKAWNNFKRELLYKYGINLNSRITNYLNTTGKKTKPKTLSMLNGKEELTQALKTAISLCKEADIDVYDILKKHTGDINIEG